MKTLIITMMAGAGVIAGTNAYKDEKVKKVMQNSQQVIGEAAVGGPFELIDQDGKRFTDKNLLGEFAILYFGFTFCPDICPDELEKLANAIDLVEKKIGVKVQPVFISIDPDRDTPPKVKEYIKEFHPRLIGLTGDMDSVKRASKAYRVYFNKTGESSTDYLVDHSIIHYLINPAGEFVTFYSKSFTEEQLADSISEHVVEWKKQHPEEYHKGRTLSLPAKPAAKA